MKIAICIWFYLMSFLNGLSMIKKKILVCDGIDKRGQNILEESGMFEIYDYKYINSLDKSSSLKSILPQFDALVVRSATKVTKDLLQQCHNNNDNNKSKLCLIARAGVGLDNIDLDAANAKQIKVINTPNVNTRSVAELVFAHIFTLMRSLHKSNRELSLAITDKTRSSFTQLKAQASKNDMEIYGKTLGIIGCGNIGREVAALGIALGMKVKLYDYLGRDVEVSLSNINPNYEELKSVKIILPSCQSLPSILQESDIITIHTPGNKEVIGENELLIMKKNVILINCARGGVVNESALLSALSNGTIQAAGIDVFEEEPPVSNNSLKLLQNPQISVSPHIGGATKEAQERVGIELANRIIEFFQNLK